MKIAYCLDHDSNQLLFNYPSHTVILFRDKQGKIFVVFVPKISYNVSYDIEFDMIRLRLSKATVPLLLLISLSNFFKVKRYV